MKNICLSVFLLLYIADVHAQNKSIDSLQKVLLTAKEDTNKVNILIDIARQNAITENHDSSLYYAKKAVALAEHLRSQKGMAISYGSTGRAYLSLHDYSMALEYCQKAVDIFETLGDKDGLAKGLYNIGIVYARLGEHKKAMGYQQKVVALCGESENKALLASTYSSMGNLYMNFADYPNTLKYFEKAITIREDLGDKDNVAFDLANIAFMYQILSDYATALKYHQRSYDVSPAGHVLYFKDMGILCVNAPDSVLRMIGVKPEQRYQQAIEYKHRALQIAEETRNVSQQILIWNLLSETYELLGDCDNAYNAYKNYTNLSDNIIGAETQKQVSQKELQYDFDKREALVKAEHERKEIYQRNIRNATIGGLAVTMIFSGIVFRQRNRISKEKKRSDELLLNILPSEVADELKKRGTTTARQYDDVTILFTDFVNFTQTAVGLSPEQLVQELHECFTAFDGIIERNGMEKIKTIGDAYMAVCGLPVADPQHAEKTVRAAIEIRDFITERRKNPVPGKLERSFEIRIGIHSGIVVAGTVGIKKFAYDIWGDTVNTASRMESSGEAGKVNISGTTYELVKDHFACTYRGKIQAKGKGEVDMYFLEENLG